MSSDPIDASRAHEEQTPSWAELFVNFLVLGVVTVGGSMAQANRMYRHIVERRHWLTNNDFAKAMEFCHTLPGAETLQLAIYIGYLKRKLLGGVLAGVVFILPGVLVMILVSKLYRNYVDLPHVSAVLFILKPTVLGIITAAAVKLAAASIRNFFFAAIMLASCAALTLSQTSLLVVLVAAGLLNLIVADGLPRLQSKLGQIGTHSICLTLFALPFMHPHWLRLMWLSLKTGLFSFGGVYASLAFLQQGAVEGYRWLSPAQLLNGVALTVATPGPFILLTTFVGYLAGGTTGAILATIFVLLPSFVLVLAGCRYVAAVNDSGLLRAFLDGFSASLAGVIVVVAFQLAPGVLLHPPTVVIALTAFLAIVLLKVDVAIVAAIAIAGGIAYAFFPGTI